MLENKTVLIVEDDVLVGGLLEELLRDFGCASVATANSVTRAFERLDDTTPDLVILDLNLNGASGIPVAEILRDRNIKFIISSGYSNSVIEPEWRACPSLPKPYTTEKLLDVLSAVFPQPVEPA